MLMNDYIRLIDAFLGGEIDALTFESTYLAKFKSEQCPISHQVFKILDRLFADVDAFCADASLRDENDLDEAGLIEAARKARDALKSHDDEGLGHQRL